MHASTHAENSDVCTMWLTIAGPDDVPHDTNARYKTDA
jgi:hypothetical protein